MLSATVQKTTGALCNGAENNWSLTTERLDSAYGWLPWPDSLPPTPLGLLADPCQNASLEGQIALTVLPDDWTDSGPCTLAEVVKHAQVDHYTSL